MIWSIICLSFFNSFLQSKIHTAVSATNIESDSIFAGRLEERSKQQVDYNISIHQLMGSLLEKHREYLVEYEINSSVNGVKEHSKIEDASGKDAGGSPPKQTEDNRSIDPKFHLTPVSKKAIDRAMGNLHQKYPNFEDLGSIVPWKEDMEAILIVYNNE